MPVPKKNAEWHNDLLASRNEVSDDQRQLFTIAIPNSALGCD